MQFKYLYQSIIAFAFVVSMSLTANGYKAVAENPIDIVICLDLSGSTNGLLVDLRKQVWDIINETYNITPQPDLRIGIVGFSRPSFGKNHYYVKTLVDITNDFDLVAHQIYSIKPSVEKGDHFVGAAISHSIDQLKWSKDPKALKLLFLVGNGDVRNGSINYASESEDGFNKKNIIVNTIFCHPSHSALEMSGWKRIAELGGGKFFDIDVGNEIPPIFLAERNTDVVKLAKELNKTYIYYGIEGDKKYSQMISADKQSRWESQYAFESRMFFKTSAIYQNYNDSWDLVDCIKVNGKGALNNLNREFLPEEYKELNIDDLYTLLLENKEKRNRIICELRNLLNNDRQVIINQKISELEQLDKQNTLQYIIKKVVLEYGLEIGFQAIN